MCVTNEIETESEGDLEVPSYNEAPNMSDEQVSAIARDQLASSSKDGQRNGGDENSFFNRTSRRSQQ